MSMFLIATDEAGYGPKLGPLVIVATLWEIPADNLDDQALAELFDNLRSPYPYENQIVRVDDSKSVFKPSQGLGLLHAVFSAAVHWSGAKELHWVDWLRQNSKTDFDSLLDLPWFDNLGERPFLSNRDTRSILNQWQTTGIQLVAIQTRVIAARQFNAHCNHACNKADLLSEATIGLVRSLRDSRPNPHSGTFAFCDRHGGRRYYGGVLQHSFPDAQMQIISETKHQSRYRLTSCDRPIEIAFTVKGDSFTPVAMSSMIAKYLRERLMESFNEYFAQRHLGDKPLKPTSGYPVDADRFLKQIQPIIQAENIRCEDLIRLR